MAVKSSLYYKISSFTYQAYKGSFKEVAESYLKEAQEFQKKKARENKTMFSDPWTITLILVFYIGI